MFSLLFRPKCLCVHSTTDQSSSHVPFVVHGKVHVLVASTWQNSYLLLEFDPSSG
jgi:hypothetical protein